jgi:hypothetical protein
MYNWAWLVREARPAGLRRIKKALEEKLIPTVTAGRRGTNYLGRRVVLRYSALSFLSISPRTYQRTVTKRRRRNVSHR